jgi:hypothetical protein
VRDHNYDADEQHLIRIFNVLTAHLLKARAHDDGSIYDIQVGQSLRGSKGAAARLWPSLCRFVG